LAAKHWNGQSPLQSGYDPLLYYLDEFVSAFFDSFSRCPNAFKFWYFGKVRIFVVNYLVLGFFQSRSHVF